MRNLQPYMTYSWMSSVGQIGCRRYLPRHGSGRERPTPDRVASGGVRIGLNVVRDRVVGGTRPHHHVYASSLPVYWPLKDYRGDIRIEERPNGCLIIWTVTCASCIPGLGKFLRSRVRSEYLRLAAALAQEAERTGP